MHEIQEKLLALSKKAGFGEMSLRLMAAAIGMPHESPQKIKHHLSQLEKKGFFTINKAKGSISHTSKWADNLIKSGSKIFSIPIIGTANCGPAKVFAETNFQGFIKVSSTLLHRKNAEGLYAVKGDGASMNNALIAGKKLEDGDFAIIDSNQRVPNNNDIVLAIIDNKATIKRFIHDKENEQIVLIADSSYDYEPIYLHADDDFIINGKVVSIIKRPNSSNK
jgi:repressor LexA